MGWPGPIDYHDAFQHPGRVLRDPLLRQFRVALNRRGLPAVRAGGFALVYKLNRGPEVTAARVFLYPSDEREERYRIVHEHLARHRPRCLVAFGYQPEGIRVGRGWYPVQTMQWVEGDTLATWMHKVVSRGDTARLRRMADRWIALVGDLHAARIAHGDLQHGNVLVVRGDAPVLVDYDGMCVPDLVGRPALEVGLPSYQHPGRREQALSLDLDRFAAWTILIALRAVAADPALWTRFVVRLENENLLFRESDLIAPARSELWPALLASPDPQVRDWAGRLRACLDRPFDQIPPFRPDRPAARPVEVGNGREVPPSPSPPAILDRLARLPAAASRANDRAFLDLWIAHAGQIAAAPVVESLKRRHAEASRRLDAHAALLRAIEWADRGTGPESTIVEAAEVLPPAYDPAVQDRIELARTRSRQAASARDRRDALLDAIRRGDHAAFLARVDLSALRDHEEAFRPYRRVIEGWVRAHILRDRPVAPMAGPPILVHDSPVLRCHWSRGHLVRHCLVEARVEERTPAASPRPAIVRRVGREEVRRAGGLPLAGPAGANRIRLTYWPVVDLGWTELRGAPVHLGPIDLDAVRAVPTATASPTGPRGA